MYNTDFLPQLEESRKHIFGDGELGLLASVDPQAAVELASKIPLSTRDIKYVKCVQDTNGEWIPESKVR